MVTFKYAVVSGGTRGIGKAIVQKLLAHDYRVITCSRSQEHVQALQSECSHATQSGNLLVLQADLSSKSGVLQFAEQVAAHTKQVSMLVNNTGIFLPGSISSEADGVFEQLINTNLASAYHLTRAILPFIPDHKNAHIFNICSTASITAYVNGGSYCISKFGLLGLSKVLREELKARGIKVTAMLPGATLTDSWSGVDLPPERFMTVNDVADLLWSIAQLSPTANVEEVLLRPLAGDIS